MSTFDGPKLIPDRPPDGIRRFTVSAWCGTDGHPKLVLSARTERELVRRERDYRCAICDAPAKWADDDGVRVRLAAGGRLVELYCLGCCLQLQQELRAPIAERCPKCARRWR